MNPRWLLIRRLRGPVYLLTFAATALLHQWDILGFGQSWPLYLIVAGILTLAERASMANIAYGGPYGAPYGNDPYGNGSPGPYPSQPYNAQQQYGQTYQPVYPPTGNAGVPVAHPGIEPMRAGETETRPETHDPKSGGRF